MIAGTYTPFILIKMQTPWGFGLLAVVWTMAAIGIVIKLFARVSSKACRPRSIWCRAGRWSPPGNP